MTALFVKILNMSFAASLLTIAVVAARVLLKKAPKWIHCVLWGMVAFRLLCPFSIESAASLQPAGEPIHHSLSTPVTSDSADEITVSQPSDIQYDSAYSEMPSSAPEHSDKILPFMTGVWLFGMVAMAIYALTSFLRLFRRVAPSIPTEENVYLCDCIETPFILGVFRPRIYLPSAMAPDTSQYVLAHEKAHIRRRDHWWKPLGFTLLSIHWFNPVLWLAYVLLCRDIELACDEKVIRGMDVPEKKAYSLALLSCSIPRHMIAACPLAFGEVGVKERVKSVLNYRKPAFWIILAALVICILVAVCFLTDPVTEDIHSGESVTFEAVVLRVGDNGILISRQRYDSDLIWVHAETGNVRVGDTVEIVYDGMIAESYPAQIHNTQTVTVVKRLLSDDALRRIESTLGTQNLTFFDTQLMGEYTAVGCEYDGKYAVVYLNGYSIYEIVKQEALQPVEKGRAVWQSSFVLQQTGKQVYLIADPDIAGAYRPGDENSWIYVYNYPGLLAVDEDYEIGLNGSLITGGGYIPTNWQFVRNKRIFLSLPSNWEYEIYIVDAQTDQDAAGLSEDYGIRIWPKGETRGKLDIRHVRQWAVCGTGLWTEQITLKPNGYAATVGYYDGSQMWSFIHFDKLNESFVVTHTDADLWWDEYEEEAMSILGNLMLEQRVLTEAEILELASGLRFHYDTLEAEVDRSTGMWKVSFYDQDHNLTAVVRLDTYGNLQ